MTDADTVAELMDFISEAYRGLTSVSDLHESTVTLIIEQLDADLALVARKDNDGMNLLASNPRQWTDTDGLLSPVSVASRVISQSEPCMLDDRSDVRSATVAEGATADSSIEYRSLVAVPFDDDGVLLAASVSQAEFADTDIDTLRMISAFAMITRDLLGAYTSQPSDFDHAESAGEILTHDAANFLSILQARLELAREDPREEHFDAIEKASRRLEELIDDTATMLLHGSREIELEHLDLDSVIQEAWNGIETRDATLVPGKLGRIAADRSSVLELLENLFRNAVEHAGPNSIVRTGLLDTDDGFYVEDDGPGMPALEAAWISDSDSEPAHMLDGVGLSIVKRIIDAHGWDISAGVSDSGGARLEIRNVDIVE